MSIVLKYCSFKKNESVTENYAEGKTCLKYTTIANYILRNYWFIEFNFLHFPPQFEGISSP